MPVPARQQWSPIRDAAIPPAVPSNIDFLYYVHSSEWAIEKLGGRHVIVPVLGVLVLLRGVNGVEDPDPGKPLEPRHYERRVARLERDGAIFLDPDQEIPAELLPEGVKAGGWKRLTEGRIGEQATRHHHDVWKTFAVRNNGAVSWVEHSDLRVAWRAWLVEQGIAPAMEPGLAEQLKQQLLALGERIENSDRPEAYKARKLKVLGSQLEALEQGESDE